MKIAHITPFFFPAICGIGQSVREIGKLQVALGHEVHVYTSNTDKYKTIEIEESEIDGIRIHREKVWLRLSEFVYFWPSVFFKILNSDFDVVHTHGFGHLHCLLASIAAKLTRKKIVHTTHCPWGAFRTSFFGKILEFLNYNFLSRIVLKLSYRIIAITPWENSYIKRYGGKKDKIVNIPNGVAEEMFVEITENDFRNKHSIDNEKLIILFFGRFNYTKAPDVFVQVAKLLEHKQNKVHFVMCGSDEGMKKDIIKQIKDFPNFTILDPVYNQTEKIKMYQASDIYLLPSRKEGLPLTLFEAMACGLGIVATKVNGIPYEVEEGKNALLADSGDISTLLENTLLLLENPQLLAKMSQNNRDKAKDYTWQIVTKKIMQTYEL
jgi:glycosyltransferase involved in cell wall biosynthesis